MAKKIVKERCIYSNYDIIENYPDDVIIEELMESSVVDNESEITEQMIWEERNFLDSNDWEYEKERLMDFFLNNGENWIIAGKVGRWDGVYSGAFIFKTFDEMFYKVTKDCDYIHFYDENGHLYLSCAHHDGSCSFEIKEVTDKGYDYYNNWENNLDDKRSEKYVYNQIFNRYSKLPHFAHKVYGAPKTEYEPTTKRRLIDKLNNQARSFY